MGKVRRSGMKHVIYIYMYIMFELRTDYNASARSGCRHVAVLLECRGKSTVASDPLPVPEEYKPAKTIQVNICNFLAQ